MTPKVLIVDDDSDIRRLVRLYLETMHQCDIREAEHGLGAIKYLMEEKFQLVITDLFMRPMNGLELVAFLKRTSGFENLPIIMLTSNGEERDRDRALQLGVNDYLLKPFYPTKIGPLIEKHLAAA